MINLELINLRVIYRCLDCNHEQDLYLPDPDLKSMFPDHETWMIDGGAHGASIVVKLNCPECASGSFYAMEGNPGEDVLVDEFGIVSDLECFEEKRHLS